MLKHILVLTLFLAVSPLTVAEPSKPIAKLIGTQASAFDFFLFRLHEQSRCTSWFDGDTESPKLCMATIDYIFEDNLIEMHFVVDEDYDGMKDFNQASAQRKETIMKEILHELAKELGLAPIIEEIPVKMGLIQMTPLRYGWSTNDFDENKIKDEIVNRTALYLRANDGKYVYTTTRNQHGKIAYDVKESSM